MRLSKMLQFVASFVVFPFILSCSADNELSRKDMMGIWYTKGKQTNEETSYSFCLNIKESYLTNLIYAQKGVLDRFYLCSWSFDDDNILKIIYNDGNYFQYKVKKRGSSRLLLTNMENNRSFTVKARNQQPKCQDMPMEGAWFETPNVSDVIYPSIDYSGEMMAFKGDTVQSLSIKNGAIQTNYYGTNSVKFDGEHIDIEYDGYVSKYSYSVIRFIKDKELELVGMEENSLVLRHFRYFHDVEGQHTGNWSSVPDNDTNDNVSMYTFLPLTVYCREYTKDTLLLAHNTSWWIPDNRNNLITIPWSKNMVQKINYNIVDGQHQWSYSADSDTIKMNMSYDNSKILRINYSLDGHWENREKTRIFEFGPGNKVTLNSKAVNQKLTGTYTFVGAWLRISWDTGIANNLQVLSYKNNESMLYIMNGGIHGDMFYIGDK